MKKYHYEITTHLPKEEVVKNLSAIVDARSKLGHIGTSKRLFGKLRGDRFVLDSYHMPTLKVTGTLMQNETGGTTIKVTVQPTFTKKFFRQFFYALAYPLFACILLWQIIEHPTNLLVYLVGLVTFFVIYVVPIVEGKIKSVLNPPPKPVEPVETISKSVMGEISVK